MKYTWRTYFLHQVGNIRLSDLFAKRLWNDLIEHPIRSAIPLVLSQLPTLALYLLRKIRGMKYVLLAIAAIFLALDFLLIRQGGTSKAATLAAA